MTNKQKIKLYINPIEDSTKPPVNLTLLSDAFDFITGKFDIVSIEIQLNEYKRPSEFYFELLSGLCKTVSNSIITNNYTGKKKNNIFKVDSFNYLNIIIDNSKPFSVIYNNQTKEFKTLEDLSTVLSVL